jgi:hypothetical protein
MEKNNALYWKYLHKWMYGGLLSFLISGLLGLSLRNSNLDWVIPVVVAILFFPLIIMARYGLKHNYYPSWRYGYIIRGKSAIAWNIFVFVIYALLIIFAALYGQVQ